LHRGKTLREKIVARIAQNKRDDVFLPREFADFGGADQVLRTAHVTPVWCGDALQPELCMTF
jgi:hypothetical protein